MCGIAGFVNSVRKHLMHQEHESGQEHMCRVIRHQQAPIMTGMLADR